MQSIIQKSHAAVRHLMSGSVRQPQSARKTSEAKAFITPEAFRGILQSIGSRPAESGGILLGPINSDGISHFRFDEQAEAGATTYTPSAESMEAFCLQAAERGNELKGFCHSHPGLVTPSGPDIVYAHRFLEANPGMPRFYMPIMPNVPLRHLPGDEQDLSPYMQQIRFYIVERESPESYLEATMILTAEHDFPSLEDSPNAKSNLPTRILRAMKPFSPEWTQVDAEGFPIHCLLCHADDRDIMVFFPTEFPVLSPTIVISYHDGLNEEFNAHWKMEDPRDPAIRLSRLVTAACNHQPVNY